MGRYIGNSTDLRSVYTDIRLVYTKTGFGLNPKSSSELGLRKAQIQILSLTLKVFDCDYSSLLFINS